MAAITPARARRRFRPASAVSMCQPYSVAWKTAAIGPCGEERRAIATASVARS
jgi:hypothetical protein